MILRGEVFKPVPKREKKKVHTKKGGWGAWGGSTGEKKKETVRRVKGEAKTSGKGHGKRETRKKGALGGPNRRELRTEKIIRRGKRGDAEFALAEYRNSVKEGESRRKPDRVPEGGRNTQKKDQKIDKNPQKVEKNVAGMPGKGLFGEKPFGWLTGYKAAETVRVIQSHKNEGGGGRWGPTNGTGGHL